MVIGGQMNKCFFPHLFGDFNFLVWGGVKWGERDFFFAKIGSLYKLEGRIIFNLKFAIFNTFHLVAKIQHLVFSLFKVIKIMVNQH